MIKFSSLSKLMLLLLALSVSLSSCEDDDDEILGVDRGDKGVLFTSSNISGQVGTIDTRDTPLELVSFDAESLDADGLWYNDASGNLVQIDRTNSVLVEYNDVIDDLDDDNGVDVNFTSSSNFSSGRGLAVVGTTQFIVAQSGTDANGDENKLVVYRKNNSAEFQRILTVNVDFALWGIQWDNGTLYAVVDKTNQLAVFNDFFSLADNATATPDRTITVDGLVRTHGLEYDAEDDIMILTDIGEASSDSDGGLFIMRNFSSITSDNLTSADYTTISGAATLLGNPVDVDYDENADMIYVAERANGGGRVLQFDVNATGNVAPLRQINVAGVSSLYLNRE